MQNNTETLSEISDVRAKFEASADFAFLKLLKKTLDDLRRENIDIKFSLKNLGEYQISIGDKKMTLSKNFKVNYFEVTITEPRMFDERSINHHPEAIKMVQFWAKHVTAQQQAVDALFSEPDPETARHRLSVTQSPTGPKVKVKP